MEYFAAERKGESPLWEEWSLEIAEAITEGKMVTVPPHPPAALVALFPDEPDLALAGWLDILQTHFSSVIGFSGQTSSGSLGGYRGRGEFDKPKPVHTGHTLHSAIDAYIEYLHRVHRTAENIVSQTQHELHLLRWGLVESAAFAVVLGGAIQGDQHRQSPRPTGEGERNHHGQDDPLVSLTPGGIAVAGADGVAVPCLALARQKFARDGVPESDGGIDDTGQRGC